MRNALGKKSIKLNLCWFQWHRSDNSRHNCKWVDFSLLIFFYLIFLNFHFIGDFLNLIFLFDFSFCLFYFAIIKCQVGRESSGIWCRDGSKITFFWWEIGEKFRFLYFCLQIWKFSGLNFYDFERGGVKFMIHNSWMFPTKIFFLEFLEFSNFHPKYPLTERPHPTCFIVFINYNFEWWMAS